MMTSSGCIPERPQRTRFPIALLELAEQFYQRRNYSVEELYSRCEISPKQISREVASISEWQFQELIQACADIAFPGTPLSVQLDECIPITVTGGMFGLALFTAKDLQQALDLLVTFSYTVMPNYKFERLVVGGQWHIVLRPNYSLSEVQSYVDESTCAYLLNFRHFAKLSSPPIQVHLTHSPKGEIADYEDHFGAKFLFNQACCKVVFDKHHLKQPLRTHNRATFEEVFRKLRSNTATGNDLSSASAVKKILQAQLSQGRPSQISQIAQAMNISERTLARRLQNENTSFAELRLQTCTDYAKLILENTDFPVSKIASICGYNSTSNFSRAFKSSTGLTPKQFRSQ